MYGNWAVILITGMDFDIWYAIQNQLAALNYFVTIRWKHTGNYEVLNRPVF